MVIGRKIAAPTPNGQTWYCAAWEHRFHHILGGPCAAMA